MRNHSFATTTRVVASAAAVAALGLTACDMGVTNPGPTQDEALNTVSAVPGLVNGMSGDLSNALGTYLSVNVVMTDEMNEAGNYAAQQQFVRGSITPDMVNGDWARMQNARWVAEQGLVRLKTILGADFETNANVPRAYLYGGFANRLLGENVCTGVIDGGPAQSDSVYFQRADSLFTRAYTLATAQKNTSVATAALAGRASVRAWLGNWAAAVADAQQVPATFVFNAVFSTNTTRENLDIANETQNRRELTVWGRPWSRLDARTPWDTVKVASGALQTGQDGKTIFFRQQKYKTLGSAVPLAKGTEMLLLRAEAALNNSDVSGAVTLMNQARTAAGVTTALSPAPTTLAAAWTTLEFERGATLWLEARRLWDLRRWNAATGPAHNTFLDSRDKCVPVSLNEASTNPNLSR